MTKKIIASVLAVAFAFSIAISPVSGATIEELEAQIAQLNATIQSLLAQLAGQTTPATGAVCFYTDLAQGTTSAEVKKLQETLNLDPATRVAASGAGAPGSETTYFGPLTLAAVKAFQANHGIITTGYVGPLTRGQLNALYCTPTPPTTVPDTTTTTVAPAYGTLSVVSYPVSNPQTTLYGANTYETVAGQYKATGSDMTVRKVGVKIVSSAATTFPWQAFTTVSVWDGDTKLAESPVTLANAIENTWAKDYTFNLSGFNWVIPNGTQKVLTVKVTTVASPVAAATGVTWTVSLLTDVVSSDTAGVTYSTVSGNAVTTGALTLTSAQASSVVTSASSDNPLAGNVIASTSATTKVDVLKFNVQVKDVNATFNSGTIKVSTDGTIVKDSYVTSLELWDGATLVAAAAPTGWGSHIGTSTWSNFNLPISAGTTKTLTVKAVLAQLPSTYANDGSGLISISTGPTLSGIDTNNNVVAATGTTVTGNNQYPFIIAPTFAYVGHSVAVKNYSDTSLNNIGDTSITFSVTANGGDIFIPAQSNATTTLGLDEKVLPAYDATSRAYTTSTTWTCNSPATLLPDTGAGELWQLSSGVSANCTLSVYVSNYHATSASTTAGFFSVALEHVKWYESATSTAESYINQSWGLTNIKTPDFYLKGK